MVNKSLQQFALLGIAIGTLNLAYAGPIKTNQSSSKTLGSSGTSKENTQDSEKNKQTPPAKSSKPEPKQEPSKPGEEDCGAFCAVSLNRPQFSLQIDTDLKSKRSKLS